MTPRIMTISLPLLLVHVATGLAGITVEQWTPLYRGIQYAQGEADSAEPRLQKVNALRINLTAPGIMVYTTPGNGDDPDETTGQTATDFLIANGVRVGINANFFQPPLSSWPLGSTFKNLEGLAVSQGALVSDQETDPVANRGQVLLMDESNLVWFDSTIGTPISLTGVHNAVCGDARLLNAGNISVPPEGEAHPRTAVGLSQNGYFLILIAIDGRQDGYSEGATYHETAEWLIRFGAYDGINLDGGGSTTMVRSNDLGGAIIMNSPIGEGYWGDQPGQRINGNHLGATGDTLPDSPIGDLNCDDAVDGRDIAAFTTAILDIPGYGEDYPNCSRHLADINGDGEVDDADIASFVMLLLAS